MNRRRFLSTLGAAATAAPLFSSAAQNARPNIVLILSDDMGYADIGCFGAKDIRTPHIDRLAREGVRLTHCYSNGPVCTPTRAALMTGRYQQRFGLEWALMPAHRECGLDPEHITIATRLKKTGYKTGMFGKWHLGWKPEFGPNAHGFDEFFGILGGNVDMYSHRRIEDTKDLWEGTTPVEKTGYLTEMIAARAEQFVDQHAAGKDPFFLYVPFNAVHWPFQVPGRPDTVRNRETWFDGTRAEYGKMLESMDSAIGRVLAALDRHNLTRNTLVIFTNDNGGERLSDNSPFFHHKGTLWEGGIRSPGIVRWPARLKAGQTNEQACMSMDFAATILAAANVALPQDPALDGMNLLPILEGRQRPVERTLFWRINREDRKQKAVRQGYWKYVRDGSIDLLFNLAEDPGERRDLGYRHPGLVKKLQAAIEAWEADLAKNQPRCSVL